VAEGTVRGAFDLDTGPAVRGVRSYREEAARADATTRQLGSTMDDVFGPSAAANLRTAREEMGGLATTARETRLTVGQQWQGMRREVQREAAAITSTIAVVRDRMRELGRMNVSPSIDLDGVTKALAQVELLHERLNALGGQTARPRVAVGGGGPGFGSAAARASAGANRGGTSGILSLGGIGFAGLQGPQLLAGAAVALPAVQALGGGAVGLAGSAGAAGLGAGAVGLGGLAPLAAGIVSVISVAKPAQKALQDAWKAQDKLTEAVRQYGRHSDQARRAQQDLNRLERDRPGIGYAMGQGRALMSEWQRLSRPATSQLYGLLGDAGQVARRVAPLQAQNATVASTAVRGSGTQFARFLGGTETQATVAEMTRVFARELPAAERTLENVALTVERLARAATPFFHDANEWVEKWTWGMRTSTRDTESVRRQMVPLVEEAKDWARLTGSAYHLLRDILQLGAPSGDSLVVSLTRTFDRWDAWVQGHPQQVQGFFRDTASSVRDMAGGLEKVVGFLNDLATALRPILDRFSQLVGLAASLGLIGTPGAAGALFGAYRGLRGAGGGGAAAGGGGGAAMGVLAGVAAGGGAAGGGVARSGVRTTGRASTLGYRGMNPAAGQLIYGQGFSGGITSQLGARTTRFGRGVGYGGMALRGAGKAAWPIMLAMAGLDAASFNGSPMQRLQNAASGATFGAIPAPMTGDQAIDAGGTLYRDYTRVNRSTGQLQAELGGARRGLSLGNRAGWTGPLGTDKELQWDVAGARRKFSGVAGQRELQEYVRLLQDEVTARKQANDQMRRSRDQQLDESSRQRATQYASGLPGAFRAYRRGGQSQQEAFGSTIGQVQKRLARTRDAGVETLGEASLDWARALAKGNPQMKKQVDALADSIERRFRRMGVNVQIVHGDILTGARQEWKQIRDAIADPVEQARERVDKDFTAIQDKAVGSLVAMGFSKSDARGFVRGLEKGGVSAQGAQNAINMGPNSYAGAQAQSQKNMRARARGGIVGGRGLMDSVAMGDGLVAPGEAWIANRHTLDRLSQATLATYGLTAQQIITGESRPHSMPGGRYATGGSFDLPSGASTTAARVQTGRLAGVNAAVSSIANAALAQFPGLTVTSTTGGGHAAGSFHYRGAAVDLAGGDMNAAAAWIGQRYGSRLAEGIHNPNLSVKGGRSVSPSFWGAQTWADHANHIHVAALGGAVRGGGAAAGLAAGVQAQINVGGLGRQQPGIAGVLRQRAGDIYAQALTQHVNAALGAAGAGGGGAPTRGVMSFNSVARLAESVGLPGVTFAQIAKGESGFNPRAIGHDPGGTIGLGLWQITTKYNDDIIARFGGRNAMLNAQTNALAAKAIYDRAGIGAWYGTRYMTAPNLHYQGAQRGGHLSFAGLFDRGGDFVTNGPTAFVAGEGPRHRRERVRITPAHARGGEGVNVTIEAGAVVVQAGGGGLDSAAAEQIGQRVVRKIIEAIDRAKGSGEL
jgi:hypothetical protein